MPTASAWGLWRGKWAWVAVRTEEGRIRVGGRGDDDRDVASMSSAGVAAEAYRHEAFFWSGEDEFLAGTTKFVREGVLAGEPVMVCVIGSRLAGLRNELGTLADEVRLVDMGELGRNPARIIPAWQQFVDECTVGGQPVRGIGEPIWAGRRPGELSECQLHEALLDIALSPETPLWLLCPYDVHGLEEDVLAEARRTHPGFMTSGATRRRGWLSGEQRADDGFHVDLPDAGGPARFRRTFTARTLRDLRDDVLAEARAAGVSAERSADLALSVHEVATNSVVHARGAGVLQIWRESGALVCEVRDPGQISDPMIGRRAPGVESLHGRGLWMVNQLCDLVQIRSHAAGTTIRLHTWL